MNESDKELQQAVRQAMPSGGVAPEFDHTWQAAQRRTDTNRRYLHMAAAAAVAVISLVIVADLVRPPQETLEYIEVADLLNSTSWSAPSDSLLPQSRFDIYQDMPTLLESTDAYGGALL